MTLYELNKLAYAELPKMTSAEKEQATEKVVEFVKKYNTHSREYFMLLNNDLHYYTLFCWMNRTAEVLAKEIMDLVECLGELKAVEVNNNGAIEFWIANLENECDMYVFFNYYEGVIEV